MRKRILTLRAIIKPVRDEVRCCPPGRGWGGSGDASEGATAERFERCSLAAAAH